MPELSGKQVGAAVGGLLGAAFVKSEIFDDEDGGGSTEGAVGDLGGIDGLEGSGVADGGDSMEAYEDYMQEQANYEMTSEMLETQHETTMEIIDNIDGSDDYYYEDDPYSGW
jgi:hypothetical protein